MRQYSQVLICKFFDFNDRKNQKTVFYFDKRCNEKVIADSKKNAII